jgi:hypothetical protein
LSKVLKTLAVAAGVRKLVGLAWLANRAIAARRAREAAAGDRYRRYADREARRERFHRYADRELARERMARQPARAA